MVHRTTLMFLECMEHRNKIKDISDYRLCSFPSGSVGQQIKGDAVYISLLL